MNKNKIILLILSVALLLGSCSQTAEKNEEFNLLLVNIETFEQSVNQHIADTQQQISDNQDTYTVLDSSASMSSQLLLEADDIQSEILTFSDKIDAQTIEDTKSRVSTAVNSLKENDTAISNYYIIAVSTQVSDILKDYQQLADKSQANTKSTQDLVDQLNLLAEDQIIRNIHISSESMVLSSFIAARDAYNNWITATKEYAKASISSQNKQTSLEIVNDYFSSTTEYYNFHLQAMDMVMTLDDTYSENIAVFLELFTPYTTEYETVIESLNKLLEQ